MPAGDLLTTEPIRCEFAIYYLPQPSTNPEAAFRTVLTETAPFWKPIKEADAKKDDFVYLANLLSDVAKEYRPPDLTSLQYYGRGLSREQAEQLQKCESAYVIDFVYPAKERWKALRSANTAIERLARETGGLIWDESTREVFSPDEWNRRRVQTWSEEFPVVSSQVTIHAYKNTDYVRAITLGMGKFGLPDVVVEDSSWSDNLGIGHLIQALCQSLVENSTLTAAGERTVQIKELKNAAFRQRQLEGLLPNSSGEARLGLRYAPLQQGDADNRLVQILFDFYPGNDNHARQQALIGSLYGHTDSIKSVKHDDELLAASQRAREQLPALREAFQKGLAPGEYIQLKAPFDRPKGGQEWMWVEVTQWQGDQIKGLLKNEPFDIPTLHGGQMVEVSEKTIFDFIRRSPDGSQTGNETGVIIEKMQGKTSNSP